MVLAAAKRSSVAEGASPVGTASDGSSLLSAPNDITLEPDGPPSSGTSTGIPEAAAPTTSPSPSDSADDPAQALRKDILGIRFCPVEECCKVGRRELGWMCRAHHRDREAKACAVPEASFGSAKTEGEGISPRSETREDPSRSTPWEEDEIERLREAITRHSSPQLPID